MDINYVKQIMKNKKINQLQLSELSGIPIQTLRKIFAGYTPNPRIDTVQSIEKALGIDKEPVVELSPIKKKLIDIISQLSDENVEKAIEIIKVINK